MTKYLLAFRIFDFNAFITSWTAFPTIPEASSEATLRSIEVGPYIMEPGSFWKAYEISSSDTNGDSAANPFHVIEAHVDVSVDSFMIRAFPTHPKATIAIDGNAVPNGLESQVSQLASVLLEG